MTKPMVAIVGKQNVGKSTLMNRVVGKQLAIVEDLPGTTRDRIFASVAWHDVPFTLVDTAGIVSGPLSGLEQAVMDQAQMAIEEADLIIFMVDVKSGITASDRDIADALRKASKSLLVVANKADNPTMERQAVEFYELGMGEPLPISAHHGLGISDLLDKVISMLPPAAVEAAVAEAEKNMLKIAITGRPGVGKSMLLNAILGEVRSIVGETPGTTRDALDTEFDFQGETVLLIDTAGIRKRGHITAGVEKYSVMRALRAMERADVVLLVLDAGESVAAQDAHIAGYIQQMVKGVVLVINKWDLVADKNPDEWQRLIHDRIKFLAYAPVLFTSAKRGKGVERLLPKAREVYQERMKRLPDPAVNDIIQMAVSAHSPPKRKNRQLKVFSARQSQINPPAFIISVNDSQLVHFSYRRYLENRLRQVFGFTGTPIKLVFETRGRL